MKKLDYFIIGIGITILLIIGIIILACNKVDKNDLSLEVLYQNETIYSLTLNDEGTYEVCCNNNQLTLSKNGVVIITKNIESKDFTNTFTIKNKKVEMIEASCSGKDCTKMYISESHLIPIICTNGIVINPTNKTNVDVIA